MAPVRKLEGGCCRTPSWFVDKRVLKLGVILVLDTRIQATRRGIAISLLKFSGLIRLDARIKSEHDPCEEGQEGVKLQIQEFVSSLNPGERPGFCLLKKQNLMRRRLVRACPEHPSTFQRDRRIGEGNLFESKSLEGANAARAER